MDNSINTKNIEENRQVKSHREQQEYSPNGWNQTKKYYAIMTTSYCQFHEELPVFESKFWWLEKSEVSR